MKVALEDFARTICLAMWDHDYTPRDPLNWDTRWRDAMDAARAVIEKHVGPLMLKACGQAMACARPEDYQGDMPEEQAVAAMKREHEVAASIVARIISSLTQPEPQDKP